MNKAKEYTVTGNKDIQLLIERYELTYPQARRLTMYEDGMSMSDIAEIEGISKGATQYSIQLARNKIIESGEIILDRHS